MEAEDHNSKSEEFELAVGLDPEGVRGVVVDDGVENQRSYYTIIVYYSCLVRRYDVWRMMMGSD